MLIPWSCVTALKLEPVGPIKAEVFGLRYEGCNEYEGGYDNPTGVYHVLERRRLRQVRDALGQFCYDPRVGDMKKHPFYVLLTQAHLALTEEG